MSRPTRLRLSLLAALLLIPRGLPATPEAGAKASEPARGPGAGDLLVAPTRVVFEGRIRTSELTLVNTGERTATYRISFVDLRMDENGGTREIEAAEPGERSSARMIRYSPREVVLEPRVAQTVRLQLRKPADLESGEYRSHLLFRAVPHETSAAATTVENDGLSILLTPIYGVSIPVIVRQGETAAVLTLSDPELIPSSIGEATPVLRVRMNRAGNQSVYGNFSVIFTRPGTKPLVVGLANGVAVYTPNSVRVVGIPLRLPVGTFLESGLLHVVYASAGTRGEPIAEAKLVIP